MDPQGLLNSLIQHSEILQVHKRENMQPYDHTMQHRIVFWLFGRILPMSQPKVCSNIWGLPNMGVPQNGWLIMENPINMDDLGVPLFSETSIYKSPKVTNLSRGVVTWSTKKRRFLLLIVLQGLVQRQGSNWTQPRQPSKVLATFFFHNSYRENGDTVDGRNPKQPPGMVKTL